MMQNPQLGTMCWIIADYWEKLYALHVEIVDIGGDGQKITCRWNQMRGYAELFGGLRPEDLYSTDAEAWEAIRAGAQPAVGRIEQEEVGLLAL